MNPPTAIVYHSRSRVLELTFGEETLRIAAELLRVWSPSAEVRGHGANERKLQTGKKHVAIKSVDAVGNYAVRITFDDGHDTGIYAWDYLHDMGTREADYWRDYLAEMKDANASRLPTIPVGHYTP